MGFSNRAKFFNQPRQHKITPRKSVLTRRTPVMEAGGIHGINHRLTVFEDSPGMLASINTANSKFPALAVIGPVLGQQTFSRETCGKDTIFRR